MRAISMESDAEKHSQAADATQAALAIATVGCKLRQQIRVVLQQLQ